MVYLVTISPAATALQPEQPSDSLPRMPISVCGLWTILIMFHLHMDPLFPHAATAVETRCGKSCSVRQTATHIHTYCTSHTCQQPLPWPLHCTWHLHTNGHITNTHASALPIKQSWSWAKPHSEGGLSDESRRGSEETERKMSKSKQCKMVSLHGES